MTYSCRRCSTEYAEGDQSCPTCGAARYTDASQGGGREHPSLAEDLLQRLRSATEGEFEVIQEIGHGGMARVYLAHEIVLERLVALKVLSPLFTEYPEIVRRFQHEARTAGQLSHPNIVPVFAVYQRQGLSFFSMPYVAGISLRELLRQRGALEVDETLAFVLQAAAGLAYAHDNGVVHRDVKPENMMLEEPHSRLVLTDFGLAKALGGESLTLPGDMIGTPHYMSPEQCEGRSQVDGRSDQYSLALVAYELLTGKHPFGKAGFRQVMMKQLNEDPPPLREQRPDIPARISDAIHRALSKDLKDRFPTIYAFGEVLAGAESSSFALLSADPRSGRTGGYERPDARTIWMRERLRRAHRRRYSLLRTALKIRRYLRKNKPAIGTTAAMLVLVLAAAIARGAGALDLAKMAGRLPSEENAVLSFRDVDASPDAPTFQVIGPPSADPVDEETEAVPDEPAKDKANEPGSRRPEMGRAGDSGAGRADRLERHDPNAKDREPAGKTGPEAPSSGGPGSHQPPAVPADSAGQGETESGDKRDTAAEPKIAGPASGGSLGSGSATLPEDSAESSREALTDLVEEYRRALESEDLEALSARIYRAEIPPEDLKILRSIFDNADELQVELDLPPLEPDDDQASFKVEHRMRFLQAVTRREQTLNRKLELNFQHDENGWRLVQLKR